VKPTPRWGLSTVGFTCGDEHAGGQGVALGALLVLELMMMIVLFTVLFRNKLRIPLVEVRS